LVSIGATRRSTEAYSGHHYRPDACLASHQNGGWIGRDHLDVDPASLAKKDPPDRSGGAFD